jgi:hypothetical protein
LPGSRHSCLRYKLLRDFCLHLIVCLFIHFNARRLLV